MTRQQKDPLRPLSTEERQMLEQLSRARREPAVHVVRAQMLLAISLEECAPRNRQWR